MTRRTLEIAAFLVALLLSAMSIHAWLASRDEQQRLASTLTAQKQLLDAADARERARENALDASLAQIEQLKRSTQTPEQILRDLPKYLPLPQPITFAPSHQADAAPSAPSKDQVEGQGGTRPVPSRGSPAKNDAREPPSDLPGSPRRAPGSSSSLLPQAAAQAAGPQRPPTFPAASSPTCDPAGNCAAQIPTADLKPLYDFVQDCRACQAQLAAAKQDKSDDATKIAALTRERDAAVTAAKGGTFWRRLRRNALWFGVGVALGAAADAAAGHKASWH